MDSVDRNRGRLQRILDLISAVAMLVAATVVTSTVLSWPARPPLRPTPPQDTKVDLPSERVSLADAHVRGANTANLAMIEYSDFQCPYCAVFARETFPLVCRKYVDAGRLLVAFKHLPLQGIHPEALSAAEAAECAGEQGKFWEMHDRLFLGRTDRDDSRDYAALAVRIGLSAEPFRRCVGGHTLNRVQTHIAEARRLGVKGTPTFLFGVVQSDGRVAIRDRSSGAMSLDAVSKIVDRLQSEQ